MTGGSAIRRRMDVRGERRSPGMHALRCGLIRFCFLFLARSAFGCRNSVASSRGLSDWMSALGALLPVVDKASRVFLVLRPFTPLLVDLFESTFFSLGAGHHGEI